jgi:2-polyprenyl-6-methoxyphenol hydroxylase-like FAD-dependent oxidoreductase
MSRIESSPARAKSTHPQLARLAIVGAGIGGLALALALARYGLLPVVIERRSAAQIRGDGLFLSLAPNGVNALRALGLAETIIAAGLETRGIAIFNERGKRFGLMDYGEQRSRFGAPSSTIGRGALGGALLDAALAAGIELRLGAQLDGLCETRDGVGVHMNGASEVFDAVIACDGLRSTVRRLVFPELPAPRYSGLIGTGGVVDLPDVRPTGGFMHMTFGRHAFFGYLKQGDGPVLWFNTYPAPESALGAIADPRDYARKIAALHADDPLDNARIMAAVAGIDRNFPVYDMDELSRWSTPRVLLMGDAAHAVAPHSGQGASMAIEDALVLAACLDDAATTESAFTRFEALRRARVATAIAIGRQAGSQKHAQSWLALRLRDLVLPLLMPLGVKAQERMFGFRADQTPLAQPIQ